MILPSDFAKRFGLASMCAAVLMGWSTSAVSESTDDGPTYTRLEELGDYERRAIREVLDEEGVSIEPRPEGKTIDRIHVVNLPVFSDHDGDVLQWLNHLHWRTLPEVVRREVVFRPGDTWDAEEASESARNLRDPRFTSLAVVLPIRHETSNHIDVLVVTRDIWSLRAQTEFELQNTTLSELYVSLTENNLLGRRKIVSTEFTMDLGTFSVGPRYFDPHLFGSHVQLSARGGAIFDRRNGGFEGTRGQLELAYPFWKLDQTWGGSLSAVYDDRIVRRFRGSELLLYDVPETPEWEQVPQRFRQRILQIQALGTYGVGEATEHRFSLGYRYQLRDVSILPDAIESPAVRRAFRRDVLPASERVSAPVGRYEFFVPEWVTYRNIDTYDLPEETRVGPFLTLEAAPSFDFLGASANFVDLAHVAGWHVDIAERAFVFLQADLESRVRDGAFVDNLLSGTIRAATPTMGGAGRLVGWSQFAGLLEDTQNRLLFAGGRRGLRGHPIGAFSGTVRSVSSLEFRSAALEVLFARVGGVLFWDVADAADRVGQLRPRHDAGIGARILVPQCNTLPFRLDWAFPVVAQRAFWPGRLSVGFGQAF